MRKAISIALIVALAALTMMVAESPARASHGNFNVHVHDDYFHPAGAFGVPTDHTVAKAACQKANPDAACDATIHVGDTITFVSPAPLAVNLHSVMECSDNTFGTCSVGADPNNPIDDSGYRNPPSPGPSGWPYATTPFNTVGTFYYRCDIHPDVMRGRIVVQPASVGGFVQIADTGHVHHPGMDMSGSTDGAARLPLLAAIAAGVIGIALLAVGFYARRRFATRLVEDD
jgi:plastocyanin